MLIAQAIALYEKDDLGGARASTEAILAANSSDAEIAFFGSGLALGGRDRGVNDALNPAAALVCWHGHSGASLRVARVLCAHRGKAKNYHRQAKGHIPTGAANVLQLREKRDWVGAARLVRVADAGAKRKTPPSRSRAGLKEELKDFSRIRC